MHQASSKHCESHVSSVALQINNKLIIKNAQFGKTLEIFFLLIFALETNKQNSTA